MRNRPLFQKLHSARYIPPAALSQPASIGERASSACGLVRFSFRVTKSLYLLIRNTCGVSIVDPSARVRGISARRARQSLSVVEVAKGSSRGSPDIQWMVDETLDHSGHSALFIPFAQSQSRLP